MEEVRCSWTSEAAAGEVGVETFMMRRLMVVGVMPKRRKDSAIWLNVSKELFEDAFRQRGLWKLKRKW
jgi:hypothetical protein